MNSKIYYIAEIGKACNGDLDYCWRLLQECKKANVDAVRFHHYDLEESVHSGLLKKDAKTERTWSFALKLPFREEVLFSEASYRVIYDWCKELGLDFIATPWDIKSFELFKRVGIQDYKIHSMNAMNVPLMEQVVNQCRNLYISTGGLSDQQVARLSSTYHLRDKENVVLMHAVCAYPVPETVINMKAMQSIGKYCRKVGYASNDIYDMSILSAAALGAKVIEKHVHLQEDERDLHKASMKIQGYKELIRQANQLQRILGTEIKHESRGEMINQEILSKSIVLKKNVEAGEILDANNLTLKLPSKGINAKQWFDVVGKKASKSLKEGDYLFSSDMVTSDGTTHRSLQKGSNEDRAFIPGKIGVVARMKDIDEIIQDRNVDYVEVHYAASDLEKEDEWKDYDLDLVVHFPEYADGKMLDLCTYDENLRQFSIDIINKVLDKTRNLKQHFKRCTGDVKFVLHPGAMTFPKLLDNPKKQFDLFADSLTKLNTEGIEVLIENMLSFAWFLGDDWSANQGLNNSFMDAEEMYRFCTTYHYGMCLDLCHAKLYTNYAGKSFLEYMERVKPIVKHLHYSDCIGIDSEGLQVGEGDIDWSEVCRVFQDHTYGWTPEIWNGHHDHGEKFYEAHRRLNQEFQKLSQS